MTTVVFTDIGDRYTVQFAYNATVVEVLKAAVPSYARSWDKTTKQWTVDANWCKPLAAALCAIGCLVVGLEDASKQQQAHDGKSWAIALFRAVGERRIAPVHRALTKVLHPDNSETGCSVLQRELNDARSELEEA